MVTGKFFVTYATKWNAQGEKIQVYFKTFFEFNIHNQYIHNFE